MRISSPSRSEQLRPNSASRSMVAWAMVLLPAPESPVNQRVTPWRNLGWVGLVQDLGDGRPAEPLGELQSLGEVFVADIGAGDVGRLDAGRDLVDGRVAVLVGQVDHLLEVDHPHADLFFVFAHRLLGRVRGVKGLAGRVFAGPGVVAADDEIGAAVVAPDDRVQQDLAGAGHAHGQGQQAEHDGARLVVVIDQGPIAAARG